MNIQDYVVVTIAVFTYLILAMVKPLLPENCRRFIPLMAGALGIFGNIWLNEWAVTFPIVLEGLASGLSATGIDQLIKQTGNCRKRLVLLVIQFQTYIQKDFCLLGGNLYNIATDLVLASVNMYFHDLFLATNSKTA